MGMQDKLNPIWIRHLPAALRARIDSRPGLHRILGNTGWLFGDKVLRLSVGFIVGVWLARYLGPEQYGYLNFALAIVGLFGAVASLGMGGVVVRDLVRDPGTANATLGTAFLLQILGGLLACALAIVMVALVRPDDGLARLMVAVLAFAMVFKAAEVTKYWFEACVASRYVVWAESVVLLVLAGVKIGLILNAAPLMAFVWALLAESILTAVGLIIIFAWRGGGGGVWRIQAGRARQLLRDSWPLILSGLAVMAYMRIDQIMLGRMIGDEAVGIYSAAVRISEVWYFIPAAIVASVFPSIIEASKENPQTYHRRMQKLYDLMVQSALVVAVPVTFFSGTLMSGLFGDRYVEGTQVLSVTIWCVVFAALSISSGRWLVNEGYGWIAFRRNLMGLILNVALNLMLIPKWGIEGAAYATLAALVVSGYLADAIDTRTRGTFRQKTRALLLVSVFSSIRRA